RRRCAICAPRSPVRCLSSVARRDRGAPPPGRIMLAYSTPSATPQAPRTPDRRRTRCSRPEGRVGMPADCRGLAVTASSADEAELLDATVHAYLSNDPGTGELLGKLMLRAPEMPMAHCLRGFLLNL